MRRRFKTSRRETANGHLQDGRKAGTYMRRRFKTSRRETANGHLQDG